MEVLYLHCHSDPLGVPQQGKSPAKGAPCQCDPRCSLVDCLLSKCLPVVAVIHYEPSDLSCFLSRLTCRVEHASISCPSLADPLSFCAVLPSHRSLGVVETVLGPKETKWWNKDTYILVRLWDLATPPGKFFSELKNTQKNTKWTCVSFIITEWLTFLQGYSSSYVKDFWSNPTS